MPKTYPYLDQVNEEIENIVNDIFQGLNIEQNDYVTQTKPYIDKNTISGIFDFEPDIIHFSGHGKHGGLVFQDGDLISSKWLMNLFENKKEIQLLFLNACYSADQISELEKSGKIKYIIGNEGEISEYSATEFASLFYNQYKRTKNIPQAYVNARDEYKVMHLSDVKTQQVFHPSKDVLELTANEQPIERMVRAHQVKVIQSKKIPDDVLNKIQDTIKAFDEDIMSSHDPMKFKHEMKNISDILSTLKNHALEYALDIDPQKLRDQNREVTDMIKKLDNPGTLLSKQDIEKYVENTYQEIILHIFKKIHFNLVVDSIDNLPPLLPEDTDYEFFGSIIGIMYSMLNSMNYLKAKINQSFDAVYKFHEDYLIYRCFDLVTQINLEFKDLTELLISEVRDDIYRINFQDCLNLINQLDNFYKQLRKTQDQKTKGSRITDLKECLENISNIEEGLLNLFRSIVLIGLDRKNKKPHSNIVYDLSKDDNALDTEINTRRFYKKINTIGKYANLVEPPELLSIITELTARIVKEYVEYIKDFFNKRKNIHSDIVYNLLKERNALNNEVNTNGAYKKIEILENDLMENTNLEEPRELLHKITNLNAEIVKEYVMYSMNDYYPDKDIHSCYERMYRTLVIVRNGISGNLEKNLEKFERYPYLYPEIAELCNFWKFRLDALERKQARKYLARINHYFANHMYNKVSKASDMKGEKNNIKLLNIKLLNKIGVAKMLLGKYHDAIDDFNKILDMDRTNTDALFNLGLTYREVEGKDTPRKFTKSIQQFEKILEKDPNHIYALTSLGILFYKIGKYRDALEMITDAIRVSECVDWRVMLAMGCIQSDGQHDYLSARSYFDKCAELNPTSTLIKMNLSQNMILRKSYDEAEILLNSILKKLETIKDRSTQIITIIMLLCLRYLKNNEPNSNNEELIVKLLILLDLKDTKLVDWNFLNLQTIIQKSQDLKEEDKQFLDVLLSIPGNKSQYESKSLKNKIQDFLNKINSSRNVCFITVDDEKIKVNVKQIDSIGKSEWNEIEWFVWNISIDPSPEFIKDGQIKHVVYQFDSTFQEKRIDISSTEDNGKFSINVMGWEERKFDLELHRDVGPILKMVGDLKEREQ